MNIGFDIKELVQEAQAKIDGPVRSSNQTEAEADSFSVFEETIDSAAEQSDTSAFDGFFGAKAPSYELQQEKPQHRVICYLAAEGNTTTEIAEKTGFTTTMIGYVLKQSWAQKRVADLIRQHGGDQVELALKGAVLDCAKLLIGTVRDKNCDIKVRSSNAKEILDRIYGRSTQLIANVNLTPEDLSDEELVKYVRPENGGLN